MHAGQCCEKDADLAGRPARLPETGQGGYKAAQKFCLNLRGILRRAGLIRDKNTRLLKSLENKYAGQRCFLIGNGPSLTPEDLDLIAGGAELRVQHGL